MLTIKMDKMWMFYSSVILLSVIQTQQVLAIGCNIVSVTSPSASTLNVTWSSYPGASVYLLELRVVNSTSITPLVVMQTAPITQRLIQGLRPGLVYQVTLKVFEFMNVVCTDVKTTITVPATSQITSSKALSSTSIRLEWSSVIGADSYILFVVELFSSPAKSYNQTFKTLGGQVNGLTPSTTYNCYVYSSNSAGKGASSNTRTITTLVQPPTGVTLVSTGQSTARITWNPVSKVLLYQVTVRDNDNPSKAPVIRNTSTTYMDIVNLEPCSNYTVGVSSINAFLLPGEASNVIYTTSNIDPVTTVTVDYSCSSGMATVTWDLVFGANMYRAVAVDGTGTALNCTSSSTSCQIPITTCGEKYQVHVTAISDDCESTSNVTSSFETVPCAPANPKTSQDCSSNVIVFSWDPTNNTFYYEAMAVDNTGKTTECRTADNTCSFTNTDCGQFYKFTVYAVSQCNSEVSQPEFVRTSPCLPTNVLTGAGCHSDMLITTWDSAAGALSYTVEAKDNTGETYNCTTSSNSCAMNGVLCGEQLSVWITASNDNCSTDKVLGDIAQTVPCNPFNVSASVDCSQDSARVNWMTSIGAIFYIAIAEDGNGNSHSCNSMDTNCLIKGLKCGQNYTASVIGTNLVCNSSSSNEVTFMTAPCPPTNIEAFSDCAANHALIVWQNHQPTGLYTATIEDQSRAQLTCTSNTVNNCKIPSLACGKTYNVTVTYNDGNCPSTSTPINMDSVPCVPEDVRASVACATGKLAVTWNISVPAENYTTMISTGVGQPLYCNSTETQCTVKGLLCGSSYAVIVFSVTGTCISLPSTEVTVQTLPCHPTNVTAVHTCAPYLVPVSWVASDGAKYYTAVAVSRGGHRSECTTNTTSCSLPVLHCGEVYTIGVSGADDNCTGRLSDTVSLNTEPCTPSNVTSQVFCSAATAQVFWPRRANAVSYSVKATSNGATLSCSGPSPNCTLSNLVCDHEYDIFVSATDGTCVSNFSAPFRQDPVPCAPQNVSATLVCVNHSALVSWVGSPRDVRYNVTLTGQDGHTQHCHTNTTSCQLFDIDCGETYSITVTPYSKTCRGHPSAVYSFEAGLCAPINVTVSPACEDRTVSWTHVTGAEMYIATATAADGHKHTCSSNYSSSCNFTGLHCGETYTVTVVTVDRGCWSEPSSAVDMKTALCPPTNLKGQVSCDTNTMTLTWDPTPLSGVTYTLQTDLGSQFTPSVYTTSNTSHTLTNGLCGQRYAVRIAAQDGNCRGRYSSPIEISTAPCQPTNLIAHVDCGTNKGNFSWFQSSGVGFYTVKVTGENGHVASCSSNDTSCAVRLDCGHSYSATLVASTDSCNSSKHADINFDSAPCLIEDVSAELQCNTNVMNVSWTETPGTDNYTAWAISTDGHRASCNSTSNSCSIHDLQCSKVYEVAVTSSSIHCTIISGSDYNVQSAPCKPENITVDQSCSSKTMTVKWSQGSTTQNNTVTATSASGVNSTWDSSESSYSFLDLSCGQLYTFTVMGHTNVCMSEMSTPVEKLTAPCPPTNVSAVLNCTTRTALVRWSSAAAATAYSVQATSMSGLNSSCSDMGTSCSLNNLVCGLEYSVVVEAMNTGCPGPASAPAMLATEPCAPVNLSVHYNVSTAQVMWGAARGASSYSVQAVTAQGWTVTCNTTNTSCSLNGLQCGQIYNITVRAQNRACDSVISKTHHLKTEPCPPTNVKASLECDHRILTVSWQQSDFAVGYVAYFDNQNGHHASCVGTDTQCVVPGLMCGTVYNVWVKALGWQYNSSDSTVVSLTSAPCLPREVEAKVDCNSDGAAVVSWNATYGAANFSLTAIVSGSPQTLCATQQNRCNVTGLSCGETYNLSFTASNTQCSLTAQMHANLTTRPCPPQRVAVDLQCGSHTAVLSWEERSDVEFYVARAIKTSGGEVKTCNSTGSTCPFASLDCGETYNFTVTAHSQGCRSQASTTVFIQTEPCTPRQLVVDATCDQGALVSWSPSPGAETYHVVAMGVNGQVHTCNTTSSNCSISELRCGQKYTVFVTASHKNCSSEASENATLNTGPCQPDGLSVTFHCKNQSAQLSWTPRDNAVDYYGCAQAGNGHMLYCHSRNPTCTIQDLECGTLYNFSVRASDGTCNSSFSDPVQSGAAPCPPDTVKVKLMPMQTEIQVLRFSWTEVTYRDTEYILKLTGRLLGDSQAQFDLSSYWTSTTYFEIPLPCGSAYSATVESRKAASTSNPSVPLNDTTAPCPPSGVAYSGNSSLATVSWNTSMFATTFRVYDNSVKPKAQLCRTAGLSCSLTNITSTNIVITAGNTAGESEATRVPIVVTNRRRRDLSVQRPKNGGLSAPVLDVKQTMSTVILVEWSQIDTASHYSLKIRKQGSSSEPEEITVYGESTILTDLSPNSIYCIRVSARNSATSGPESEPVCVQIGEDLPQ